MAIRRDPREYLAQYQPTRPMRMMGGGQDRAAALNAIPAPGGPQGMLGGAQPAQDPNAVSGFFDSSSGNAALNQGLMAFGSNLLQGADEGRSFGNAIGQAGLAGGMAGFGAYQGEQQRQQGLAQQQQQAEQIGMLGEQMGLTPEQQGVLAQMPQEEALGLLSEQAFAPGADPVKLGQGQTLVDPTTGQQIAAGPAAQPDPGAGLIEVQGGLWDPVQQQWALAPQDEAQQVDPIAKGRLDLAREEFEFERQLKEREAALKAQGGGEPTFAEEQTIRANAKEIPKLTSTISQNKAKIGVLQKMKALNERVPFSRIGDALQSAAGLPIVGGALDLTGIYTGEDKTAADQWASYINEYARTGREEGSGPLSDTDIKLALAEIGGQSASQEARAGNIGRKIEELTKATSTDQLTAQLVSQNPSMSIAEARQQAQQQLEAQTQQAGQQGGGAAPAPGTVEDGYRYIGGDPGDPNSWQRI